MKLRFKVGYDPMTNRWYVFDCQTQMTFNCNSKSHAYKKASDMRRAEKIRKGEL